MFILDNHRPLHLANIYSKYSVVVFDDTFNPEDGDYDEDSLPSDGSDLSGGISSSDSDSDGMESEEDEEEIFEEVVKYVWYLFFFNI